MPISSTQVRDAARILADYNLGEIEIENTDEAAPFRVRLVREAARAPQPPRAAPSTPEIDRTPESDSAPTQPSLIDVSATVVGLFRTAKTPLQVGDSVARKQVLGSVESLKTPNDILCPADGRILEIHANEGQGVEFGQLLFIVEAASTS